MKIDCLTSERAMLGESPVWSPNERAVYWIDILKQTLHRTTPHDRKTLTWEMPGFPGMISLRRKGGLVIALQGGVYAFDPQTSQLDLLVPLEDDIPENRPNDGKCDAAGRLWLGTMNATDASLPTGNFYRIDTDLAITRIRTGYRVPNGLAWNPDNTLMFHADTRGGLVHSFNFDLAGGNCDAEQDFFAFDKAVTGGVDGAAMDAEGGYWVAMYGGRKVIRLMPDGRLDREIPLPVSQPTMPVFGGDDMNTLFITSARQKLTEDELTLQPLAGELLALTLKVKGSQVYPFGG